MRELDPIESKSATNFVSCGGDLFCSVAARLQAQGVSPELFSDMQWRLIGPFRGGRAVAVAGVPGDGTTYLLWLGRRRRVEDPECRESRGSRCSTGSRLRRSARWRWRRRIPQVIYAGTGESDIRSDLSSGDGVYKSSDGGKTWEQLGLRDTRQISRIVVDPKNADVVYVGALGHAYGPNPSAAFISQPTAGRRGRMCWIRGRRLACRDSAMAAESPAKLFAGTWQAHRPPWTTYAPIEGGRSGLFRTTDGGATGPAQGQWIAGGRLGTGGSSGLGERAAGIRADRRREEIGLYRSDDGGDTWTLATTTSG